MNEEFKSDDDNIDIAQVAHDFTLEKSVVQDVTVAHDVPSIQWYWIDALGDRLYPGSRPLSLLTCLDFTRFSQGKRLT
jgi:hypothetical protein